MTQDLFCPGLAEAVAEGRGPAQALVLRALQRLEGGEYSEAEEDLRQALRFSPSATAAALLGLTCLLTGRGAEARLWLDRAVRKKPGQAWPYLLRALGFRRFRRLESACLDLARAARLKPSAWTLALRSEILSEMDDGPAALRDLGRAMRLAGPRLDLLSRRARLLAGSGLWARALKDLNLALRLAPDSRLYFERARARLRLGRSREAEQDLSRTLRIMPGHEPARFSRLRLRLGRGALREAREDLRWLLAKAEENRLEAVFYQGYLELKSGRCGVAGESFRRLSECEGASPELRRRAGFYRILCRTSAGDFRRRHPASPRRSRLVIAGLGMLPPYTASLETCQALRRCDVVFDNVTTEEAREFLGALGPEVRPLRYDGLPQEARTALYRRTIFRDILKGRVAGFATRGHAMVAGVFAKALIRHCRRLGISYEVLGAVSCLDLMSSQEATFGQTGGLQAYVFDDFGRLEKIETGLPLLLFPWGNSRNGGVLSLQRSLERFYPPGHPCRVYGSRYDISPVQVPLERLASSFPSLGTMRDLYLPPLKANGGKP